MKRWWVQVRDRTGRIRNVKPAWARKAKGELRYTRARALRDKLRRRGKNARMRMVGRKRRKWSPERAAIRRLAKHWGMKHTSGDRPQNTLAGVGRVSDHWDRVATSWADDYYHPDRSKMDAFANVIETRFKLKQVLVHDAGSGLHVHVAGWTRP